MKFFLLLLFCFAFKSSYAQLEKGNWLVGGSGSFSSEKYDYGTSISKTTHLNLSPAIGYFFANKLAGGLKPIYTYQINTDNSGFSNDTEINQLGVSAFLSYYLLKKTEPFNFFTQVGYGYIWRKASSTNKEDSQDSYEITGGPVYFVNQSIGINLFLGYSINTLRDVEYKEKRFLTGIGFQIHLTKK